MVGEVECEKLQVPNSPSWSGGYLLDTESGGGFTMLDIDWIKGLQSLGSRSQLEADRNGSSNTPLKPESCVLGSQPLYSRTDLLNHSVSSETFDSTIDGGLSIEDQWFKYPASFSSKYIDHFEDVSCMFSESNTKDGISNLVTPSGEIACPPISKQESNPDLVGEYVNKEPNEMDVFIHGSNHKSEMEIHVQKRLRKPPRRFIHELPDPKSRTVRRRSKLLFTESKEQMPRIKHHKCCDVKSRSGRSLPEESIVKAIQVPFGPVVGPESQKRQVVIASVAKTKSQGRLVSSLNCSDNQPAASQNMTINERCGISRSKVLRSQRLASLTDSDENGVGTSGHKGVRGKHHILWTTTEVMTLIDGVSRHGVGRWSLIKKELFSSSSHRTSVDLKDKWRNLLKATYLQRESKKRENGKQSISWRPLPKSILRRVKELSIMYPYPRDLRSKH